MASFKNDLDMMRELTGITDVVSASDPNPEVGLGQSQMAAVASSNALKPIFMGYRTIYLNTMRGSIMRLQVVAKSSGGDSLYNRIIGMDSWRAIKIGSKRPLADYGLDVNVLPTPEDRQSIELQLQKASAAGKNGKPAISTSDYFAVRRMISSGSSLKAVQVFLANREMKQAQEDSRLQKENMEQNTKSAMAIQEQKEQAAIKFKKFETDQDIRLEYAKLLFKSILEGDPQRQNELDKALLQTGVQLSGQQAQQQQSQPPMEIG